MAQSTKGISKSISKPFPSLPQSKLHLYFFASQPWQPWQPASCLAAAKLASATETTPAATKKWLPDYGYD